MFVFIMIIAGFIINVVGFIVLTIEHEGRIEKLYRKMNREGLNLVDLIVIGVTPIAHAVLWCYYMVVSNHSRTIYEFFHKPRIKKGEY